MKKLLLSLLLGLVAIPASASLYNYYQEQGLPLPSVVDRSSLATECGISGYRGTYDQNIKLEECLRNNGDFTPELGAALASSDLTQIVADFRSSLAQKLSVGGTTMTLQSVVDDDGVTLASGKYSFTLDGSSSNKEYIICDLNPSTKVCSNIVNISRQGVRTSGAVREHRVGSAVTITDYTSLKYHNDILEGVSSTTGGLLLGNGKISGLYNLDGTFTWIKYNTSTSEIQWSNNGSDYYNFTSSSITQLTASSTAGIGVTDSNIYLKASSTLGGAFDASGNYYQKTSSTQGILTDSNGIYFDYTRNNTWTGTNTFSGTTTLAGILNATSITSLATTTISNLTITGAVSGTTPFISSIYSTTTDGDGSTYDFSIDCGFNPKLIKVNFYLQGFNGGAVSYSGGESYFEGTTTKQTVYYMDKTTAATNFGYSFSNNNPSAGDAVGGYAINTLNIQSITGNNVNVRISRSEPGSAVPSNNQSFGIICYR